MQQAKASEIETSKKENSNLKTPSKTKKISVFAYPSQLNGTNYEIVYRGSGSSLKLSELQWELKNIGMINLGFDLKIDKKNSFRIKYSKNITNESGKMVDYDWLDGSEIPSGDNWTHRSVHTNELKDAYELDLKGKRVINNKGLNFIYGFKKQHFSWESYNGSLVYTSDPGTTFRDIIIPSPGNRDLDISYEQNFNIGYIGVGVDKKFKNNLQTSFAIEKSIFMKSDDLDLHHNRNLKFIEKSEESNYTKIIGELKYPINKKLSLYSNLSYERVSTIRADTEVYNMDTGELMSKSNDNSGMSTKFYDIGIGMEFNF